MANQPGRPSKLTEEIEEKLLQAIRIGTAYELACNYAEISYVTFRNWIKRGERAKSGEYREFLKKVRLAEGKAVVGWLAKIEKALNDGDWKAAAWKLSRRYPKNYGKRSTIEVTDEELVREYTEIVSALEAGGVAVQIKETKDTDPHDAGGLPN